MRNGVQKKNRIKKLRREDDSWCHDQQEMRQMASDYFQTLFTNDPMVDPSGIVDLMEPSILTDDNADLCKDYTDEEIGDALFQIGPLKAPGPDCLPGRFF